MVLHVLVGSFFGFFALCSPLIFPRLSCRHQRYYMSECESERLFFFCFFSRSCVFTCRTDIKGTFEHFNTWQKHEKKEVGVICGVIGNCVCCVSGYMLQCAMCCSVRCVTGWVRIFCSVGEDVLQCELCYSVSYVPVCDVLQCDCAEDMCVQGYKCIYSYK